MTTIQVITPNSASQDPLYANTLFLAGPTEVPWRDEFLALLEKHLLLLLNDDNSPRIQGLTIYDPFQPDWDATWREDYVADPRFRAQVDWELDRQDAAAAVAVFFDARTRAPVSLLELGLCARRRTGRALVGCQPGFWKRGNVQAVCERYGLPLEDSLEGLVARVVTTVLEEGQVRGGGAKGAD